MKKIVQHLFAAILLVSFVPVGFIIGCIWFGIKGGLEACGFFLEWLEAPVPWRKKCLIP